MLAYARRFTPPFRVVSSLGLKKRYRFFLFFLSREIPFIPPSLRLPPFRRCVAFLINSRLFSRFRSERKFDGGLPSLDREDDQKGGGGFSKFFRNRRGEKIESARQSRGALHQFAARRRRRRLLDKRSNSLCKEIYRYEGGSIPPLASSPSYSSGSVRDTFPPRVPNTFHVPASRHPVSFGILQWRGHGTGQMIHEDVKRRREPFSRIRFIVKNFYISISISLPL